MMDIEAQQHRELAAIMFTDMVGFSALAQENEVLALQLLEEHRQLLRQIFPKHGGKEIQAIGDAFFVRFASALEAVQCAIHIQKRIADRNAEAEPQEGIRLRIGLHLGDVVVREGNLYGDGVNIAARIEPLAAPEGICLSEDVARQVRNKIEFPLQRLGRRELKNIDLPVEIYAVELPWHKPPAPKEHAFLHYDVLRKLGEGSMSVVYQARDTRLNRIVAMKFLKMESEDEKEFLLKEARIVASLNHPNICMIFAIEEVEGRSFLVVEYVDGPNLQQKLEANALPIPEALELALQIANGLKTAHEQGIFHRDIKSANIMLTAAGQAKIMDFGLAKIFDPEMESRSSMPVGTVAYMAPEILQGERPDQRADLWSLGVLMYEMATGRLPFFQNNYGAIINAILKQSPLPPADLREEVPKDFERLILKCLRKDRRDRYSSAQELIAALEKLKKRIGEMEIAAKSPAVRKSEPAQEPEWRHVTVMFSEISGYGQVAESIGMERAALIMKGCFETFGAVVEKHGGNYELQDTGLIAYFGIPNAVENASHKAIHAALEMRARLQQLNRENNLAIPFHLHMGINTGRVVAGIMGSDEKKEFTAIGATITQAAQLKIMASKGQIYVGPLTYKSTQTEFDYARVNNLNLNGGRVPVYKLLTPRMRRASAPADRMIYSEMIGRDRELSKLELHVLEVINGKGAVLSISGEAGIGKSRLLAELARGNFAEKASFWQGRTLSTGSNLGYHPFIIMLKSWAQIAEEDGDSEAIAKLERAIRALHPEGVAELLPFIATLMGFRLAGKYAERVKGIEGEAMEKLIMKSMRDLMIKGAALRPIVCIIEDLHWADLSSLELLESLFPLVTKHKILFILLFRPNYTAATENILETIKERCEGYHAEMHLEPLSKLEAHVLVQNLVKSRRLPADMQAAVTQRAEGNPFFIEAVVHSFVDAGILQFKNGKLAAAKPVAAAAIPATIQEVLMARIDRLDPEAKNLLKIASVIGKNFFYKILAEVARSSEQIETQLAHLKAVQLIQERSRLDERECVFKHALVQEVAYESILISKRQELHLKVARAIETVFAERIHEFYGMLAFHFSRADEMEKAEEFLIRAGAEALKAAASSEALNYYQAALKIYLDKHAQTAEPAKVAMLERNIAMALYNKGYMAEALPHFDEALACLGKTRASNRVAAIFRLLWDFAAILKNLYWPRPATLQKPDEKDLMIFDLQYKKGVALSSIDSKRWFMETINLFSALGKFERHNVEGLAGVHAAGSAMFNLSGISFALSKRYLSIAQKNLAAQDAKSMLYYKVFEKIHHLYGGSWSGQADIDEQLVDAALRLGELFMLNIYLGCAFIITTARGEFQSSQRLIEQISSLSETYDYDWGRFFGNLNLFIYCLQKREFQDKMGLLDRSLSLAGSLGVKLWSLRILSFRAKAQIFSRELNAAEETLAAAQKILLAYERVAPHHSREYFLSRFMLDVVTLEDFLAARDGASSSAQRRHLFQRARRSGKLALKISAKTADKMPESLRLMGVLWRLMGKPQKALRYLDKSAASAEHLGAQPDLARTYVEFGKTLGDPRHQIRTWQGVDAGAFLEKAGRLCEELDLKWDLQELNEIRRRL